MKKNLFFFFSMMAALASAQVYKTRPDAFAPIHDTLAPKVVNMATTIDEMANWDKYPTYPVYVEMMQRFAQDYPSLCRLDTIGTSVQGRLILCLAIKGTNENITNKPEFLYSSTMHGDEVTGFYLMLRLCDTLLSSYGTSDDITYMLDHVDVYINPLSNPDGTYHGGDQTVARAWRYNSNYVDLNRNYPDPFGTAALDELQIENEAMIAYVSDHNFSLSANLHGGSEVMNYPWDSFTSRQRQNEHSDWWQEVGKRFVDTCRMYDNNRFRDVNNSGVIDGGDWYVISNGRQDYFNYYHGIREITMELSSTKTVSTDRLNGYWHCESHALINYIKEIYSFTSFDTIVNDTTTVDTVPVGISSPNKGNYTVYPNPTTGPVTVITPTQTLHFNLSDRPSGVYFIPVEDRYVKVVKH